MLKPQPTTRWDPRSRAGAVAVRRARPHDMMAVSNVADVVMDWASYVNVAGTLDNVETSAIQGTYDWRSYLQEEAEVARQREAARARQRDRDKKPARAPTPPAPAQLYA